MPCINSTSAGEGGGRTARVEGGRVLVGVPGGPGWTMTGFGSGCWDWAANGVVEMVAARNARAKTMRAEVSLRSRGKSDCLQWDTRGKIIIGTKGNLVMEAGIFQRGGWGRSSGEENPRLAPEGGANPGHHRNIGGLEGCGGLLDPHRRVDRCGQCSPETLRPAIGSD